MIVCSKCGNPISRYTRICRCGHKVREDRWGVIQLETTGLDEAKDEILKIVVLDRFGNAMVNTLFKPAKNSSWPDAERVNHISPRDVADAPFLGGSALRTLEEQLSAFSVLITNGAEFTKKFLDTAQVKYPEILGISNLFKSYMNRNGLDMSCRLDTCATHFGYSEKDLSPYLKAFSKAAKIWYCYQKLDVLDPLNVLADMGKEIELNGLKYKLFLSEMQMLDYLKSMEVCPVIEKELPSIYYDGRFLDEPTIDCYMLGISFEDDGKTPRYIVLSVKNSIIAVKLREFWEMQGRKPAEHSSEDEISFFGREESTYLG